MIEFLLKNKELIAVLSGIGTFISAMIAVFTLKEVKKQRLSLYQPDILLKSFTVLISKSPLTKENEELLVYKVSDFNDYSKNYNLVDFDITPKYKVNNLGLGIAKHIKCKWDFDSEKAIKLISKLLPKDFHFSYHAKLNLYFLHNSKNEDFHYSANANISKNIIDYIPPINIQEHFHYHSIPEIIIFTHYLFLLFKNNLVEKNGDNFGIFEFNDYKFPSPTLNIEYRDINNKKYIKTYKFNISAVGTQVDDLLDLTKDFSYLQFEVK